MRRSVIEALSLTRWLDVRPGEWEPAARAFAILLLIVAGPTALGAPRDAMFLIERPPAPLGRVYLAVALLTLPLGVWMARRGARTGGRRMLAMMLLAAVGAVVGLYAAPATMASAVTLYIFTGLVGALVVPQFWAHAGRLLTVAQARRLLGPIAAAGMIGGVLGSSAAATVTAFAPGRAILLVAAA